METPWLIKSAQHVGRYSSSMSDYKRSHQGCFSRLGAQGSAITVFNPFAAQSVAQTRAHFLSLSGSGRSNYSIYYKGIPSIFERMCRLLCWRGCTKQCHFYPWISWIWGGFLVYLGLEWLGISHSAISTFLECHYHHKVSNLPFISKLMGHFYLQHCPSQKHFDPWHVENLLSLLES